MFAPINKKFGLLILALLFPSFSHAQVFINEIMYDLPGTDSGREWVEVYNAGSSPIDLSTYKFSEATTNHTIKSISGSTSISSGSYGVIADDTNKFLVDWPGFSGNLFDSSFSLNNTGATLTLKDSSSGISDQVTYSSTQGANGDGNTLQKSSPAWISAVPTPGSLNSNTPIVSTSTPPGVTPSDPTEDDSSGGGSLSSHTSIVSISEYIEHDKFSITAGRDRLVMVGIPVDFEAKANMYDNNTHYSWTFGDGTVGDGKKVKHTYQYPGDYVAVVNGTSGEDKYVSRTNIKVIKPKLVVEEANEVYIKIKNDSGYEVNLFGSEIDSGASVFKFPKDSIILKGNSAIFSSEVTNLHPNSPQDIVIKNVNTISGPVTPSAEDQKELADLYEKTVNLQKQLTSMSSTQSFEKKELFVDESKNTQDTVENVATPLLSVPTSHNRNWRDILKEFFFGVKK